VLGQRGTAREARRSGWGLVRRHGRTAPGPHDLLLPPEPAVLSRLSDAQWHRADIAAGLWAPAGWVAAAMPGDIAYNKFSTDAGKFAARLEAFADDLSTAIQRRLAERI